MGVSEHRVIYCSTLNSRILIIRTPNKVPPPPRPNFRKLPYRGLPGHSPPPISQNMDHSTQVSTAESKPRCLSIVSFGRYYQKSPKAVTLRYVEVFAIHEPSAHDRACCIQGGVWSYVMMPLGSLVKDPGNDCSRQTFCFLQKRC